MWLLSLPPCANFFSNLRFDSLIRFLTFFSAALYSSFFSPSFAWLHSLFFRLISRIISWVIHAGLFIFLFFLNGTCVVTAKLIFSVRTFQASSTLVPCSSSLQSSLPSDFLMLSQSAFLQSGSPSLSVFCSFFTLTFVIIMTWSLLPSLPTSWTSVILSGMLVRTKSSVLPFVWVTNSTIWVIRLSSTASRNSLDLPFAVPFPQSMSGMLKSPISTLFLSAARTVSANLVTLSGGELGGLYTSVT